MKKSILVLGLALAAVSCNINYIKPFDDADAFVAFPSSSISVYENGAKVSVPVHLTSLGGLTTSVSYSVKDDSAVQGTNYKISGGSGVINFAAGESEKTIDFEIIDNPGVFTGDLSFIVELSSASDVKIGASSSAKVTIVDIDHPLSKIFGTYEAKYVSYFGGTEYEAEITVSKNPDDPTMVFISNLDPYFASYSYVAPNYNYFYGNVNADKTVLSIPTGQLIGYEDVYLETEFGEPLTISISEDGSTMTTMVGFGMCSYDGFWEYYLEGIVFTKID